MTLSFVTLSALSQVSTISFKPMSRQELSRQRNARSIGKDFGSAVWMAIYGTDEIPNYDAVGIEAEFDTLDGVIFPFEAWDVRRPWPLRYRDGSANDGVLHSVNANNKALALSGLLAGQVISIGDYLSFDYGDNRALHRVSQTVTADGDGLTAQFEVRPHLRPGWELETAVNLKAPRGLFNLVPGSFDPKSAGSFHSIISFQAAQYISNDS
jgi:hypothetical protein